MYYPLKTPSPMPRKTETLYVILQGFYLNDLIDQVKGRLKSGWKPQGGPFYGNGNFYQAMTKIVLKD